jgi:Arc/MetJ-type ribon-helix-helix transcriptional regulator
VPLKIVRWYCVASIHFRCHDEIKEEIEELVRKGLYQDVSEFMVETLLLRLRPEETREQQKKKILYIIQTDAEIRKELGLK